jgi:hypothetical protein
MPEPAATAVAPATPQLAPGAVPRSSATTPVPQAAIKVVPPVVKTPVPIARSPQPATPPAASLTLDLNTRARLKSQGRGLFSKIALKTGSVTLDEFRKYYRGRAK